jgi:hypothetical protein
MSDHAAPPVTGGREPLRLTYAELGARLRCSADAARQVVRRKGWTRLPSNRRGAPTTVLVPEDELSGEEWRDPPTPPVVRATPEASDRGLLAGALAALEGALATLGEQLTVANARADRAEGERDRLLRKLATAEAELLMAQAALREAEERSLERQAGEVAPAQPASAETLPAGAAGAAKGSWRRWFRWQ